MEVIEARSGCWPDESDVADMLPPFAASHEAQSISSLFLG